MLELHSVSKRYSDKQALQDVSLTLASGEIVGLFGENGAGKTTLMKCILGLIPHEGEILLDGAPVSRKNVVRLSFATNEHSFFPNLSAEGNAGFYRENFPGFRQKRFDALMDFFELPRRRPLKTFSTGQKNQIEVILALCQGAEYILMDEPFSGSDLFNREDFYRVLLGILEPNETILLSTHLIEEVSHFVSRAVLLHEGTVLADVSTSELEDSGKTLIQYIKESYHYRSDRVANALDALSGGDR